LKPGAIARRPLVARARNWAFDAAARFAESLFMRPGPVAAPVAVIDIGSNSGRVVVYEILPEGHLRILASSRASLRLVRDLKEKNTLSAQAINRTLDALADFHALAIGSGARRTLAVATSAIRDADNGPALLARVRRELGLRLRIISGREEAHYGALGALRGLPVEDGIMFDLGGGSLQISLFRARRIGREWSFPLGALRLSDTFLSSDPPSAGDQRRLAAHVRQVLKDINLPQLGPRGCLVGTGGTVRNLAKIDQRSRPYPLPRLHGYPLERDRVEEIVGLLSSRRQERLAAIPGLNDDRVDSIVGGSLATLTLMKMVGADDLLVAGQGVREGLAASLVSDQLPPPREVRMASIAALGAAFRAWDSRPAAHRAGVVDALFQALEHEEDGPLREMLVHAATLLDIGRSIDFFERYEHVADIVLSTDLLGFSHREVALLSAIVRSAGDESAAIDRYQPLLDKHDRRSVERAATLLALSDEIEQRCTVGSPPTIDVQLTKREARLSVPGLVGWRPRRIGPRFEQAFGRRLVVAEK
jgi:exopolyphosphatase / guanosine-5'-triphosphate,3'-diphosphate pyrophosphatase